MGLDRPTSLAGGGRLSTTTVVVHISILADFRATPGSANLAVVNPALLRLLVSNGGMVAREAALAHVEHDVLDRAVRSGRLLCPYPRVYIDPELGDDRMALTRAAVLYAGGRAPSPTCRPSGSGGYRCPTAVRFTS